MSGQQHHRIKHSEGKNNFSLHLSKRFSALSDSEKVLESLGSLCVQLKAVNLLHALEVWDMKMGCHL